MKYLFFDIECSNCFTGNGKICEFGYVLTDEKFNIIRKDVYPMNPGKGHEYRFDLKVFKRDPSFQYAYDFDYYYSCEEFPYFYDRIAKLIDDPETIVIGHAVDNDINYLDYTCRRYKLRRLNYNAYNTQMMIQYYSSKHTRFKGLKGAADLLCDHNELVKLQPHLSRDDAMMTMMVTREMCKNLNCSLLEMLELCPKSKINSLDYMNKSIANKIKKIYNKSKAQILWENFYREHLKDTENENCIGKLIAVSGKIKKSNELTKQIIEKMVEKNFIPYDDIGGSDYFLIEDEEDEKRLKSILRHPYKGKYIKVNDFLEKNFN